MSDLLTQLDQQLDQLSASTAFNTKQIRLTPLVPLDAMFEIELPSDHPLAPGWEILAHPDAWNAMVESYARWATPSNPPARADCACGIPVVVA